MHDNRPIRRRKVEKWKRILNANGLPPQAVERFLIDRLVNDDRLCGLEADISKHEVELRATRSRLNRRSWVALTAAISFALLGALLIVAGLGGEIIGRTQFLAGAVVALTGSFPWRLFNRTAKDSAAATQRLERTCGLLRAAQLAKELPVARRDKMLESIIVQFAALTK